MQHDRFIGLVQDRAALDSRGAAESATRATLETLSDRLAGGLPENLASQLPAEIGTHLGEGEGEAFELDEFCRRVAERETFASGPDEAVKHAHAVLSVVDEATTGDVMERVRDQLPDSFRPLLAGVGVS